MTDSISPSREHWAGAAGFILATAGSAVGLGNLWKFPYVVGENGGGAFVLIYLICILIVGAPLMLCGLALGRHTQKSCITTFRLLSPKTSYLAHTLGMLLTGTGGILIFLGRIGIGSLLLLCGFLVFVYGWRLAGVLGTLAGFLILSFYMVVGGWILNYAFFSAEEIWTVAEHSRFATPLVTQQTFDALLGSQMEAGLFPWRALIGFLVFTGLSAAVVGMGVKNGIEKGARILMPLFFVIITALIVRGMTLPDAAEQMRIFMMPDLSKIHPSTLLEALGHAFFSLSLGMGVMITYGSYASRKENLLKISGWILLVDTGVSLAACFAIFPFVFSMGMKAEAGPGLMFTVLPQAFQNMGSGGAIWGFLFFVFILIAAITSAISILEVIVSAWMDELKISRRWALLYTVCGVTGIGLLVVFSSWDWYQIEWLHSLLNQICATESPNFFEWTANLSSHWMLPVGGFLTALFAGWVWTVQKAVNEMRHGADHLTDIPLILLIAGQRPTVLDDRCFSLMTLWGILIRFITPSAILAVLLHQAGWL